MQKNSKKLIQTSPARLRPRLSPSAGTGAYRKLQIKVILILPAKPTVRVNINASVQYNDQFSLAFILAYATFLPLRKRMLIPDARLTMEDAYYRNFKNSRFAQLLPKAQRLEAKNAKMRIGHYTVQWH